MQNPASDADLVRETLGGNAGAFAILVQRYQKAVYNAAFRLVNNVDDAKDITQKVFLKVYENLNSYRPRHEFYRWIYRITINEALNAGQQASRTGSFEPAARDGTARERGPEEACALSELNRRIQEALMSLSLEYRTTIVLKHMLNCSYADIAQITNAPEETVKSRLYTARRLLRDHFLGRDFMH